MPLDTNRNARRILYLTTMFFWFSQSSAISYIGREVKENHFTVDT